MSGNYGMVMPFVVVESKGGPYEDDAYVAGYEAGLLDGTLRTSVAAIFGQTVTSALPFHTENVPQLDLVAMRYGYVTIAEDLGNGWTSLTFEPAPRDDETA